ncbi:PQQ-dependent sugar dehydrogenase [Clostridium sp. SYSU_GA19001]|uniref:PQQ-dependent sugar dehydrogenase n=1 Tax=Clostridium caldaquaticum TaxID=2940653 RepID=UPI0020772971|nr:PQQ-dependent sugar dehydrogenase [Clostridium caldaquaticum]MCM8711333.1 PQQ-dependent sugar dehydrogenase [Clostridium caldaquaticum]
MKKFTKIILMAGILLIMFFVFSNFYENYSIQIKDSNLTWGIKYKGIDGAKDFAADEAGNFYIAYKDRVQYIDRNGKSYNLLQDKTFNINAIEYYNNKLYFASDGKIISYDLDRKEQKLLIDNIPNYGDYKESIIKILGNELFVSVGSATNSGVVGNDNEWIKDNPFNYDLSPKDITVKGKNFGTLKSGAFVPYKTKNLTGQLISGHFPGNGSIIYYDLSNGYGETFAWGIRNITGMAFNSEGKLIAAVGGMEDRGLRPIKGDVDYIYEIKKNAWYGWPDYSGGDPVNSPRFRGENNSRVNFILDNHPTTNPPAPIYQHSHVSSIDCLEVDDKGDIGEKDCIYFYDNRDNILYALSKSNILNTKVAFRSGSKIHSLKIYNKNLYILEESEGILFNIQKNSINSFNGLKPNIVYYLLSVILIIIIIMVWKLNLT